MLNACTKVEHHPEQQSISKLENRVSCLGLPFSEFNVGEMHNEYVILLYNDIHVDMTPKIIEEKLKLNYLNLSAGLYANDLQKNWVDSLTFSLIEELSSKSFDFTQANGIVFDSIRNTDIFPYFIEVISAIEGMKSLKNLHESLDLILVAAANNVDCVGYDALLGSIQIAKSSAILWSPIEQGGLGFYEEIYGAQNEKAISEWLKRTVKDDASSSMTYMLGVGNPKRQHDRQKTNRKMKDKMPTLQQNQKSCIPTLIANAMQHICFCPNAPTDNNHGSTERQGI